MLLIRARDLAKHILGLVLSCLPGGGVRGELIIIVFKILWSSGSAAAAAGKRDTGGGAGGVGGINQSMHT